MIYKLNSNYLLRGWERKDWVLVRNHDKKVRFLDREQFQALLLCDGETEVSDDYLGEGIVRALKKYLQEGIISICNEKAPIHEEQYYKKYTNRFVKSITWSMTGRCNFRCRHCFMDAPAGCFSDLDTEQAMSLIDQMAECGIYRVHLTGGEALVRRDFWQLVDRMIERGIRIEQLYTNGWLVNDDVLDGFERRNVFPELCISFDGVGHHDWMRGIEGAEKRTLEVIRKCTRRGFIVLVEMCVHKGNKDSVRDTVRVLAESGVIMLKIGQVSDSDLWIQNCEGNRLSASEYYDEMIKYIPHYYEDRVPMQILIGGVVALHPFSKEYRIVAEKKCENTEACDGLLCGSARLTCYITSEGRLLPCMPMTSASSEIQNQFPLIKDMGLKQGLSDSFYMEFISRKLKDLLAVNEKCNKCPHKYQCGGGCRATAVLNGSFNLMGHDPDVCLLFENGYPDKIRIACDAAIAKYYPDAKKDHE